MDISYATRRIEDKPGLLFNDDHLYSWIRIIPRNCYVFLYIHVSQCAVKSDVNDIILREIYEEAG